LSVSLICGLTPARQSSRLDLNQSLREDSQSATAGAHRSVANVTPLSGYHSPLSFDIEGHPPALPGAHPSAEYRAVSHDYFRTMGISGVLMRNPG